jgi:hypothetical protein
MMAKTTTSDRLREALSPPLISPQELFNLRIVPLGRNGIYEALKRGEIESVTYGKKKFIKTAPLRRQLGME